LISNHVDTSPINYEGDELLKVVVPGLQRLGSAVMNITGEIFSYDHFRSNER